MPSFKTSAPRPTSSAPKAYSPAIRVEFDSAFVALTVTPSRIGLGEVQLVKAIVNGRRQVVAFFHFDGTPMTMAQELACEMANVVVCCCPNRLPAEFQAKHLLSAFIPADPGALCLTYEGRDVSRGKNGSVIAEYFLGDEGFSEGCEASFRAPTFEASENSDGSFQLEVSVPSGFDLGPVVQDAFYTSIESEKAIKKACRLRAAIRLNGRAWMVADWNCVGEWATSGCLQDTLVTVTDGRVVVSSEVHATPQLSSGLCPTDHHIYGYVMDYQYLVQSQVASDAGVDLEVDDVAVTRPGLGYMRRNFLFQEVVTPSRFVGGVILRGCNGFEDLWNSDRTAVVARRVLSWSSVEGEAPTLGRASEQAILDLGYFITNRFQFGIEVEGRVYKGKHMKLNSWWQHEDGSVKACSTEHRTVELSSHVLTAETLEEALAELSTFSRECGFESSPTFSAGVHVHISPEDGVWTEADLAAFRRIAYVAGPGILNGATAPDKARLTYCGASSAEEAVKGQGTRYRWLNVDAAFKKFGTVEFRLFDGTHDIAKLREMVHFAKSVGTLVQEFGQQAADELLDILGGAR